MTIGTSIFLSSLFVGMIILYIFTRTVWKWKRILKILLFSTIALAFSGSAIGITYWYYQSKPKIVNEFLDISLDLTKEEVRFFKGAPTYNNEGHSNDNKLWIYGLSRGAYMIDWKDDKILHVTYSNNNGDSLFPPDLNGINSYCDSKNILEKYGNNYELFKSNDGTSRMYVFVNYNTFYFLHANRVKAYGIFNAKVCNPNDFSLLNGRLWAAATFLDSK